jgi:hypothetical protein
LLHGIPLRSKISIRGRRTDDVCDRRRRTVWPSQRTEAINTTGALKQSTGIHVEQSH